MAGCMEIAALKSEISLVPHSRKKVTRASTLLYFFCPVGDKCLHPGLESCVEEAKQQLAELRRGGRARHACSVYFVNQLRAMHWNLEDDVDICNSDRLHPNGKRNHVCEREDRVQFRLPSYVEPDHPERFLKKCNTTPNRAHHAKSGLTRFSQDLHPLLSRRRQHLSRHPAPTRALRRSSR